MVAVTMHSDDDDTATGETSATTIPEPAPEPEPQQQQQQQQQKPAQAQRRKLRQKPLRFLDRMAQDAARRSDGRTEQAATQWASVKQTEWAAAQQRDAVRPTRKAMRKFSARQKADIARRREEAAAAEKAAAPAEDPNVLFVASQTALRQPPKFESTGYLLEPGESVVIGERRVHGRRVYAETDRGAWIALRQLSAAELRAAAVRQACAMTSELLAGTHGQFAAIKPVAQLLEGLSSTKLAAIADASVLAWEFGDAQSTVDANTSQLMGLPRPPSTAEVGTLSRWLIGLGESLSSAAKAGVPYALQGERLSADHKLLKQRQWTSDDLSASTTLLQRCKHTPRSPLLEPFKCKSSSFSIQNPSFSIHNSSYTSNPWEISDRSLARTDFRNQLAKAIGGELVGMGGTGDDVEASMTKSAATKLETSVAASAGGYDEYADEGFDDDDDDEIDDVAAAANTAAHMGAQAEARRSDNFFSRLQRGSVGKAERPAEMSVHKPLEIVDQLARAEEKFSPEIGPSWKKHHLEWEKWALSDDVVSRMNFDSKSRQSRDRLRKAAEVAVEEAAGNAAALSARTEYVNGEQQFYIHRRAIASEWNRQIRVRVETAPVASGAARSTVASVEASQTMGEIATRVAAEMEIPSPVSRSSAVAVAAPGAELDESAGVGLTWTPAGHVGSAWTLARGAEVLDLQCTAVQVGLLPSTVLYLVPAGTKDGGSLRNNFSSARRAHDLWGKRQQKQDQKWKQRAELRPRRGSAPQLTNALGDAAISAVVMANAKLPQKVKSFLTRVADDAQRRQQATEDRLAVAKIEVVRSSSSFSAGKFSRQPSEAIKVSPRPNKASQLRAEATAAAAKAAAKAKRRPSSAPKARPPPATVRVNRAAQLRSVHGAAARKAAPRPVPMDEPAVDKSKPGWQVLALAEEYGGYGGRVLPAR